ncbi:hypothetical protein HPT25_16490 [Bacillus sp. BRMEA1]|nr:hypothetical protein [Neobacillus endophyticus]NRD78964.1 hypothetical protein [Neobacillus endophyticus]
MKHEDYKWGGFMKEGPYKKRLIRNGVFIRSIPFMVTIILEQSTFE